MAHHFHTIKLPSGDGCDGCCALNEVLAVLCQHSRGQEPAVTPAPDADFGRVHVGEVIQEIPVEKDKVDLLIIEQDRNTFQS